MSAGAAKAAGAAAVKQQAAADGARRHRGRFSWWLLAACWLSASLLGLVALLQLMVSHGDVDDETFPHDDRRTSIYASPVADVAVMEYGGSPCRLQPPCSVTCQNTHSDLLSSIISQLIKNDKECAHSMSLEVINVEFPNNALAAGWLDLSANLWSLVLNNCSIIALHDDAFSTSLFAKLEYLTLRRLPLHKLQAAAFRPLQSVTSLSVDDCPYLQEVEPQVTATLPGLTSLQVIDTVYGSNRQVLPAITSGIRNVAIADFQHNALGTLRREDLGAAVNAASLYLQSSGIREVQVGTFPSSGSLLQLYLNSNNLTTLKNMSISFEGRPPAFSIRLEGNYWNCNCSLLWLLPHVDTFADTPRCYSPQHFAHWKLTSALEHLNESCTASPTTEPPETTESSTIETSQPTSEETTTEIWTSEGTTSETGPSEGTTTETGTSEVRPTETPDNTSDLPTTSEDPNTTHSGTDSTVTSEEIPTSKPPDERPPDLRPCYHIDLSYYGAVEDWVEDSIQIQDVDEFTLKISVPHSAADGFIAWKGTDSQDCYEASPLTKPIVVLENLKPEVDYDICVLRPEEERTSIHNCQPHKTMAEYSKRPWLSNGQKKLVVALTALVSVVSTILLIAVVTMLLWRYPTLIFKDVCFVNETTVIKRKERTPSRRHSFPNMSPRRPSSNPSASSVSYIEIVPSPVEVIARFLRRSTASVKRMFRRQEGGDRQSPSIPSTMPSNSSPRPSVSPSTYSAGTGSTLTVSI